MYDRDPMKLKVNAKMLQQTRPLDFSTHYAANKANTMISFI